MPVPQREENGKFPTFAFPGGYPIYYLAADNEVLCPDCANFPEAFTTEEKRTAVRTGKDQEEGTPDYTDRMWELVAVDIHEEGLPLTCSNCNKEIPSAYGPTKYDYMEMVQDWARKLTGHEFNETDADDCADFVGDKDTEQEGNYNQIGKWVQEFIDQYLEEPPGGGESAGRRLSRDAGDLFTTPRKEEADFVKSVLRKNHIRYESQEEDRGHQSGWRYCIYVSKDIIDKASVIVDEALTEREYEREDSRGAAGRRMKIGYPITYRAVSYGGYLVKDETTDKDVYIQVDYDFPGLATSFGWNGKLLPKTKLRAVNIKDDELIAAEIYSAIQYLDANEGKVVEDPGYFGDE